MPPRYSALKIDGQRAYDLARAGKETPLVARTVMVHNLTLLEIVDADHALFEAEVGKGCYIRALARDLALSLGTLGHLTTLQRRSDGKFSLDDAISLETLAQNGHGAAFDAYLHPIETALDDIPALALTAAEALRLKQGQALAWFSREDAARLPPPGQTIALATADAKPLALVEIDGATLRPIRVINL